MAWVQRAGSSYGKAVRTTLGKSDILFQEGICARPSATVQIQANHLGTVYPLSPSK